MKYSSEKIQNEFKELFEVAGQVEEQTWLLLSKFNEQKRRLFDFPSHQRIFLFILTRSIKTYSSIKHLCQQGYGQDVCNLLRTLLENLITVKYILQRKDKADALAKRFVFYKWIIFRRQMADQEKNLHAMSESQKNDFLKRKEIIQTQVNDFKKIFHIKSDQALITWSGRTVRDMARLIDAKLLEEYDTTFRLCSRFSHPSILGDQEYMIQDDKQLIFSPLPSPIGIVPNLKSSIRYMIELLNLVDELYNLDSHSALIDLNIRYNQVSNMEKHQNDASYLEKSSSTSSSSIKESIIVFNTEIQPFSKAENI